MQILLKARFSGNWGASFVYLAKNFELLCITAHRVLTIVDSLSFFPSFLSPVLSVARAVDGHFIDATAKFHL